MLKLYLKRRFRQIKKDVWIIMIIRQNLEYQFRHNIFIIVINAQLTWQVMAFKSKEYLKNHQKLTNRLRIL